MKIAAIVSEYNPFHNGHAYQLGETRRITGCDYVVAIMSGSYTQRGEPAICDKWSRTAAALENGVDAVFEIPSDFAMASAEYFAYGGAGTAGLLGCDYLSFGAESSMEKLSDFAETMCSENFTEMIRKGLDGGLSYPRALSRALGTERLLPNDMLAVQYIKTLSEGRFGMVPVAVKRCGAQHSGDIDGILPDGSLCRSGSEIRKMITQESFPDKVKCFVPSYTYDELHKWSRSEAFKTVSDFDGIVSAFFRNGLCEAFRGQCGDDIENGSGLYGLVRKAAAKYNTLSAITKQCTSKYYTMTRISRYIMKMITGGLVNPVKEIYYARLLGFRKDSSECIKELKRRSAVPLVEFPAKYIKSGDSEKGAEMMRRDIRAQAVYNAVLDGPERSDGDRDYSIGPVIL